MLSSLQSCISILLNKVATCATCGVEYYKGICRTASATLGLLITTLFEVHSSSLSVVGTVGE